MTPQQVAALAAAAGRVSSQGIPQVLIGDEFFVYTTGRPAAALAAGGTSISNIQIQADSDFLLEKTTFTADVAAAAQTFNTQVLPHANVTLVATSSGRQLMNVQLPLVGLFGTGQLPFIWPRSYLFPASSTLQITLVSFEAANANFITLNFIGRKIYWK